MKRASSAMEAVAYLGLPWGGSPTTIKAALRERYRLVGETAQELVYAGMFAREDAAMRFGFPAGGLAVIDIAVDLTQKSDRDVSTLLEGLMAIYTVRHGPPCESEPEAADGWHWRDDIAKLDVSIKTEGGQKTLAVQYGLT